MNVKNIIFFLPLVFLAFSCNNDTAGTQVQEPPTEAVPVPPFDRDSAYAYIEKQLSFGPRALGMPGHQACKEWLAEKLASFGATVIEQDFQAEVYTGDVFPATNIIGQFNPESTTRILLAAHWDTRHIADSDLATERREEPIPGADDGASGVGVLLEIARQLGQNPIDMGVDIIFFDAEDYGQDTKEGEQISQAEAERRRNTWALGAQHWSRNPHVNRKNVEYGILLDMVGAEGARFPKEGVSMAFARPVVEKVWKLAKQMGYSNYFVDQQAGEVIDDHYFVNTIARIPMIDIIHKPVETETGFGPHWHTHNDDIGIIDKRTLRAVGQLVTAVVYRENNGQM